MGDYPSYDELLQELAETYVEEGETHWRRAALMYLAVEKYEARPNDIAAACGCSGSTVQQYVKTFAAFPDPSDRLPDIPFTIYKICARTEDPQGWLRQASENMWSTRDLQRAINGGEPDGLEKAMELWQKLQRRLDQGGELAEKIAGVMVRYLRDNFGL